MNWCARCKTEGYTLWEVLLVIALMGVILGGAYLNYDSSLNKSRQEANQSNIVRLEGAIQLYRLDMGEYPLTLNELIENQGNSANWRGPYIAEIPPNPWNPDQSYQIDASGQVR